MSTPAPMPVPMPYGMSADEMVEQIREQDENWAKVTHALGNFLAAAFPHASAQAHDLTRAIQQLMQTGSERQMRALKTPPPAFKPTVEVLARIVADRDRLVEVLEKLEKGIESGPEEMRDFFEATAVMPVRHQLEQLEEQLSNMQKLMERE